MKKIIFALMVFVACMTLSFGETYAYDTCDPNNIFLPCTSPNGRDMDTVMRGGTRTVFYLAESHTVDHRINHKENYWDIVIIEPPYSRYSGCLWKPAYVASFYSASIDRTQANFLWQGVGSVSSLTTNLDPSGGGGVVSIPEGDGIYCGIGGYNICQFDFQKNSDVEIQAYPADGWAFAYWEWNNGASSSTENPMTINMDSAKTVKAKFYRTFRNAVGSFRKNIGDGTGGQCLDYVEYETDLPNEVCVGDAGDCYDQARAAGYAVGSTPREGSIVVFAKVPNTSLSHGHVGIVKYYDTANNKIIVHESNWCDNNCEIVGEHEEILGTHTIVGYVYYTP